MLLSAGRSVFSIDFHFIHAGFSLTDRLIMTRITRAVYRFTVDAIVWLHLNNGSQRRDQPWCYISNERNLRLTRVLTVNGG